MGADEVNAFLTSLAVDGQVSAATQNQALSAILFLYRCVLDDPLPWIHDIVRANRAERVPVVLTSGEVRVVIAELSGASRGQADDSALELATAAKTLFPGASPVALVTGSGVDAVCQEAAAFFGEVEPTPPCCRPPQHTSSPGILIARDSGIRHGAFPSQDDAYLPGPTYALIAYQELASWKSG